MTEKLTAQHWWYIRPEGPEAGTRKDTYFLEEYLKVSRECSVNRAIGWVYKVSDGSWVGVLATPRTIKFYPTEEAAITAIMLRGG